MSDADPQSKFVWPPKPLATEGELADRATRREASDLHVQRESSAQSIVSSASPAPRVQEEGSDRPADDESPGVLVGQAHQAWLRSIEETWLGLVTPSFEQRARDDGWTPDLARDYCGRCGHSVGPHSAKTKSERTSCSNCVGTRPRYSRVVRLGAFDGLLRDAIHEVKFTAWRRLGTELGRLLGHQIAVALESERIDTARVVLLPMPTTIRRRLVRGIDHTTVLARGVRDVLGASIVHGVVRQHRPSQTRLPQSHRRDNVARTMHLKDGVDVFGRLVIIVDDVMTTGSTMGECARAIRAGTADEKLAPLDVWAAVLAVAGDGNDAAM